MRRICRLVKRMGSSHSDIQGMDMVDELDSCCSRTLAKDQLWAEQIPHPYERAGDHPTTRKNKNPRASGAPVFKTRARLTGFRNDKLPSVHQR